MSDCDTHKVMKRCSENIWYFLRYCVQVVIPDEYINRQYLTVPLGLNDANIAFIWLYQHKQSAILLGARQFTCKTTILHVLYLYQILFGNSEENGIYIPPSNATYGLLLKNIIVPTYMIDSYEAIVEYAKQTADIHVMRDTECVYFIDQFMHRSIPHTEYMKNPINRYYMVDSIGPDNADLVRYTIPFSTDMYDKDIEAFSIKFLHFTGYRPSYLITFGVDDFNNPPELKELLSSDRVDEEGYRKDFAIISDWKM